MSGFNSFYAAILNYPHVNLANATSHLQLEISGILQKRKAPRGDVGLLGARLAAGDVDTVV